MKALLVIDIKDELLEDYEDFFVDCELRAYTKDDKDIDFIKYVEDCPLRFVPDKNVFAFIVNNEVHFLEAPKIDESFYEEILGGTDNE